MPSYTISSPIHPEGEFPDDTDLRVEWVADQREHKGKKGGKPWTQFRQRMLAWTGLITGTFTHNYDPGKYVWKAHKHTEEGIEDFKCKGSFLVGLTEEEWKKISHMKPKMQQARMTTDGVTFTCKFPGCGKRSTSQVSALLHESEDHYGINLIANPEYKKDLDERIDAATQKVPPRRGRPPKNAAA